MRHRSRITLFAAVAALVVTVSFWTPNAEVARAADPWKTASESYYRLDVPNGQASVHVDVEVLNVASADLPYVILYAMPVTKDVIVTQDGTALTTEIITGSELGAPVSLVKATFLKPLKKNARTKITLDYVAPPQTSEYVKFSPGAMEALFISQGPGSFVLLDAPTSAETYLDPGCLKANDQPKDLRDSGLVRHVCGEAAILALEAENKGLLDACAGMDDKCRQRLLLSPYSAFGQSITDTSLRGTIEEVMNLGKGPVTVTLRYFRSDETWAQNQFAMARKALPMLETFYGSPYPHERITMLQSNHLANVGALGVAFNEIGTVLLASETGGIDEEVTVHELAHQWAHYDTMKSPAMVEGLAEYAAQTIIRSFGMSTYNWGWDTFGYTDPISTWWVSSFISNSNYWYGKSAAFWAEYATAIGGQANLTAVLTQVGPFPEEPVDFRWFMDRGEEISGANLDELFMKWVFAETAANSLSERRAAHTSVAELKTYAATTGLTGIPTDLQDYLVNWEFVAVKNAVTEATALVDAYAATLVLIDGAGLPRTTAVQEAWPKSSMKVSAGLIEDIKQAISAIQNADAKLAPDAFGRVKLEEARVKFAEGDLESAEKLASGSLTMRFNTDTAITLIEVAKQTQANFKPNLFTRIGLWGKDPDADLAAAEQAMADGKPEVAIEHAKAAYTAWDGAKKDGYARLALSFAALGAIATGTWWGLKKIDGKSKEDDVPKGRTIGGHVLAPSDERKGSWKDWENTP